MAMRLRLTPLRAALTAALLACLALAAGAQPNPPGPYGYLPGSLPPRITEAALSPMAAIQVNQIWGFIGRDYSAKSLEALSLPFMALQAFDDSTIWPATEALPAGFDPASWLRIGKGPGLGLDALHAEGIIGTGVSVAVIDKPIRSTHAEFAGRIDYFEVFGTAPKSQALHFHGLACASVLAGAACGVAPGARLYYFAVPDDGRNFLNFSRAVDRLLEVNAGLADQHRIRIVSVSDGMVGGYDREWAAAMSKLRKAGVALIYSGGGILSGFLWGGCPPYLDRDDPADYRRSPYFDQARMGSIIIPADFRTTASNAGDEAYVYWGKGGYSWAMPYAAGLAALAWQLRPRLSYGEIEADLRASSFAKKDGERVLDPGAFIERIKARR